MCYALQVPSNPDNTSEKPTSAVPATDVRNTAATGGSGGSTASTTAATNHVGANEKERERGQNGEIDYRKVLIAKFYPSEIGFAPFFFLICSYGNNPNWTIRDYVMNWLKLATN